MVPLIGVMKPGLDVKNDLIKILNLPFLCLYEGKMYFRYAITTLVDIFYFEVNFYITFFIFYQ